MDTAAASTDIALRGLHPAMGADTAGSAQVATTPRVPTEATLVTPRVATSAAVMDMAVAVAALVLGVLAAVAAVAK